MATQTSAVPAYLAALKAALDARAIPLAEGEGTVLVTTAPSGAPVAPETIQFFTVPATQGWAALGNRRKREEFTVRGGLYVELSGAGEEVATAARERAYALLAELEDALRLDPGVSFRVRQSHLAGHELDQGIAEGVRWASLSFAIEAITELTSN